MADMHQPFIEFWSTPVNSEFEVLDFREDAPARANCLPGKAR